MKLTVLLGVLLLGGVGVFLWSFMEGDGVAELEFVAEGEATSEEQQNAVRDAAPPLMNRFARETAAPASNRVAPRGALSFQSTEGLDDSNSILVEVVHAETQEPFADGIFSLFRPDLARRSVIQSLKQDPLFVFRSLGHLYRLSGEGRTRIPFLAGREMLVAFNDRYAGMHVNRHDVKSMLRLEVREIRHAQVRLRNSRGEPLVGLTAQIGVQHAEEGQDQKNFQVICEGRTNDQGVARIPMFPWWLDQLQGGSVAVTVSGLMRRPVLRTIAREDLLEEIIEVEVPDAGSLTVKVVNRDGRPLEHLVEVAAAVLPDEFDGTLPPEDFPTHPAWEHFSSSGTARIQIVDCNLKLLVCVRSDDWLHLKPVAKVVDGPAQAGENVTVTLRFDLSYPVIAGRLVDEEGRPESNARLTVMIVETRGENKDASGGVVSTDADGRFSYPIQRRPDLDPDVVTTIEIYSQFAMEDERKAEVVLPVAELMTGAVDLGDIVLARAPLLVSGMVRDENGAPVAGAEILIRALDDASERRFSLESKLPVVSETRENGTFEVRGTVPTEEFKVMALASGLLPTTKIVRRGEKGVDFLLSRSGALKGRLVLEGDSRIGELKLMVVPFGGSDGGTVILKPDGSFHSTSHAPGQYGLKVYRGSNFSSDPLEEFGPFEVLAGNTTDVGELSLTVPLYNYHLELVEPEQISGSTPIFITAKAPGSGEILSTMKMYQSRGVLVIPGSVCDLVVVLGGFRELHLSNVTPGKVELRLTRGIPVRFKITNREILPEGFDIVGISVRPRGSAGGRGLVRGSADGMVHLIAPGDHEVAILLAKKTTQGSVSLSVSVTNRGIVKISDSSEVQEVEVRMDPMALEFALTNAGGF